MTLIELMSVMTILTGAVAGYVAAHSYHAGVLSLILFTVGGLLIGIGFGVGFGNLADSTLSSKKLSDGMQLLLSLVISLAGLFAAMFAPPLLAWIVYR